MQEAEETAQLWEILCGVLDQFVEILGEEHLEQSEFERLFRLVLTQYSVGTIPVALDQGPSVRSPGMTGIPPATSFCWEPMTTCCRTPVRAAAC